MSKNTHPNFAIALPPWMSFMHYALQNFIENGAQKKL